MPTSPDRIPRTPTRVRRAMGGVGQNFVPYTGALKDVDLGTFDLTTTGLGTFGDVLVTSPVNIYLLSHDSFADFVGNEHIDHTTVTLTAGIGISGGGDISASRSFAMDILGLTTDTIAAGDWVPFHDLTDAPNKITFANFESTLDHDKLTNTHNLAGDIDHDTLTNTHNLSTDIDHDGLTNYDANKHIDHTGVTITTGDGLAGGGDISVSRTFTVDLAANPGLEFSANKLIAKIVAPLALSASGISMPVADTDNDGYLATGDWDTFNGKADYSFGANNFSGTGTVGCGTITLTANSDVVLSGTGFIQAGSEGFIVGTLTITDGTIDDTDGAITFGDTNLTTTGLITAGNLDVDTLNFNGNVISDSTGTVSFDNDNITTTGNITVGPVIGLIGDTGKIECDILDADTSVTTVLVTTTDIIIADTLTLGTNGVSGGDVNFYSATSGNRLFWDADRANFSASANGGTMGERSTQFGYSPLASGNYSFCAGYNCTSSGSKSFAFGNIVIASATLAFAWGDGFTNSVASSFAVGFGAKDFTISATTLTWNGIAKLGDGGITNYAALAADGELTLHGTARVLNSIWIGAEGVKAPPTKPATYVDHGIGGAWEFSDATDDTIVANMKISNKMDRNIAPSITLGWSSTTQSAFCEWQIEYLWQSADEDTTAGADDTLLSSTDADASTSSATAEGMVLSTFPLVAPSATDVCLHLRIKRRADLAADTINGDTVELHGICMGFTSDKLGT